MMVFKDIIDMESIDIYIKDNNLGELFFRDGLFFGGFQDDLLFGLCQVNFTENGISMGMIHITKEFRGQGLGNAMVRSLFNKLDLNGIKFVYSQSAHPYLEKLGFKFYDRIYGCNLEELFNKGCSCCGVEDHVQ